MNKQDAMSDTRAPAPEQKVEYPERLWVGRRCTDGAYDAYSQRLNSTAEYVRADLAAPVTGEAEREAELVNRLLGLALARGLDASEWPAGFADDVVREFLATLTSEPAHGGR